MPARLAAAIVILPLLALPAAAANSPGPPWPEIVGPASITLRWYPDELGEGAARRAAAAHCAASGRTATMAALERDGSAELGTYFCR